MQFIQVSCAVAGALLMIAASAASGGAAQAAEFGDADAGRMYAKRVCAECHAVQAEDPQSPNVDAPSFPAVANTPGMTRTALNVWFQTPHPTMPNLIIKDQDLDNVIAYIVSLKSD